MTLAIQRIFISMPGLMHRPQYAQVECDANCEALLWVEGKRAVVLFVDIGGGTSVTNGIDHLIQFVVEGRLRQQGVPWQNAQFFGRDSMGAFDQVVIDAYDDTGNCEANWLPMPARVRTLEGFRKITSSMGFLISEVDIKVIQSVMKRADMQFKEAA